MPSSKDIDKDLRQVAESLVLADMTFRKGKMVEAEAMYERSLAMLFRTYAEAHPDIDACLLRLSDIYFSRSKYAQALSTYMRLHGVRCRTRGLHHADTQAIAFKVAKAQEKLEQYEEAADTYQTAISEGLQWTGPAHPLIGSMMESYALLLRRHLNDPQRAADIDKKAKEYRSRTKSVTLSGLARLPESLIAAYPEPAELERQSSPLPVAADQNTYQRNSVSAPDAVSLEAVSMPVYSDPASVPTFSDPASVPTFSDPASVPTFSDSASVPTFSDPAVQTFSNPVSVPPDPQSPKPFDPDPAPSAESIKLAHPADPKTTQHRFIGGALQKFTQQHQDNLGRVDAHSPTGTPSEVRKFLQTSEIDGGSEKRPLSLSSSDSDSPKTQFTGSSFNNESNESRAKPYLAERTFDSGDRDEQRYQNRDEQRYRERDDQRYRDQDEQQYQSRDQQLYQGRDHDRDESSYEQADLDDEEYYEDDFEEGRPRSRNFLLTAFVVLIVLVVPIFIGWTMLAKQSKSQANQQLNQHSTLGGTSLPLNEPSSR